METIGNAYGAGEQTGIFSMSEGMAAGYLERLKIGTPQRSERDEQLAHFQGRGIQVRNGKKGYRDATDRELALALAHIPTSDLHAFHRQCEQARSYPRFFWWALKPRT